MRCGYHADDGHEIPIVEGVTQSIPNGQRIVLLGANGQGKSTLIKTLDALSGTVPRACRSAISRSISSKRCVPMIPCSSIWRASRPTRASRNCAISSAASTFPATWRPRKSRPSRRREGAARADAHQAEAKSAAARRADQSPPPRNAPALTMALAQFEGTLILVSHDRHLLRATTDTFMLVAKHRLSPFDGDLGDYRDWLLQHAAETRAAAKEARIVDTSDSGVNRKEQRKLDPQERQKLAHLKKPLQTRIAKIEKEMEKLNAEKAKLTDTIRRQGEVSARLESLERDWLEEHTKNWSRSAPDSFLMGDSDVIASLDGLRVLDLTRLLPGPVATLRLAELSADVLKIEAPGEATTRAPCCKAQPIGKAARQARSGAS